MRKWNLQFPFKTLPYLQRNFNVRSENTHVSMTNKQFAYFQKIAHKMLAIMHATCCTFCGAKNSQIMRFWTENQVVCNDHFSILFVSDQVLFYRYGIAASLLVKPKIPVFGRSDHINDPPIPFFRAVAGKVFVFSFVHFLGIFLNFCLCKTIRGLFLPVRRLTRGSSALHT